MRFTQLPVTLGMQIRAIRLGFFTIGRFYMRLSRAGNNLTQVELHPLSMIDGRAFLSDCPHIVWWDMEDRKGLLDSIKPLRGVLSVKRYISFLVNDSGELVA